MGLLVPERIIAERDAWRQRLITNYSAVADRLQVAYTRTLQKLEPYRDQLIDRLITMAEDGETITPSDVRGLPEWGRLLARIEIEMAAFARLVEHETGIAVDDVVPEAVKAATAQALITVPEAARPAIEARWIEPDPEALRRLISYLDSPAYREKFEEFGPNAAQNFADTILSGFAQGKHPTTMARAISNWFGVPFAWANNSARTVYLYSSRAASHATYARNNAIVRGWMWWATFDGRTCRSCIGQHGKVFPVDQELNDHHSGRCSPVPVIIGTRWADEVVMGPERFAQLGEADQRQVLGPQLFELFKAGRLPWGEVSKPYQNDVFGEMLREATVSEVLRAAGGD